MQNAMPNVAQLELKNLDKITVNDNSKRSLNGANNHQNLAKLYLTRQILEECLETLDIFKEMMEDPIQRNKIIRDVGRALRLKAYDEEAVIYNKGENSISIYMVIKGNVSLCMPIFKETHENLVTSVPNQRIEFDYQEIDTFNMGQGFGEAEFIHGKKRSLVAKAKSNNTIIGVIDGKDFEQVIELYKQRIYYKKIEMFSKCPLLQNVYPYQLEFIVNNAKPFTFTISKEIVRQEEKSKALYLITEGQIELRRINHKAQQKLSKYSTKIKTTIEDAVKQKIKIRNIVVGVLQEGGFLGDGEIALDTPYNYSAICKSEKVRAYICDERIILSQMTEENFQSAREYYRQKNEYRQNKSTIYQEIKSKIQKRIQDAEICKLDKNQIKMKKMISNRYVEKRPSLIGQMSPRDIGKIVQKKYSKLKEPLCLDESQLNCFPSLRPNIMLKADQRAYSPLLKRSQIRQTRKYSSTPEPSPPRQFNSMSLSHNPYYPRQLTSMTGTIQPYPQPSSLLILMRPFHNKVQSLHERLAKECSNIKKQKKQELDKISAKLNSCSQVEMVRMSQFISKIKQTKKK